MTDEQETALYDAYTKSQPENKSSLNATAYDNLITGLLQQLGFQATPENIQEAKLVIDLKKAHDLPTNRANKPTMINSAQRALTAFRNPSLVSNGPALTGNASSNGVGNNSLTGTIFNSPNSNTATGLQQANAQPQQSFNGGKPKSKSKSKSSTKKPKAKKSTKGRK
jgi:hypothetical protein